MKEISGRDSLDSIYIPETQMCVDVGASTLTSLQSKELGSSLDEQTIKVRKPYTITKQRERWTEEEHEKFLEALKLYGRAWRRIEEHIGTKTAVQIRSHAQKFFSKVVREPADVAKAIEIPPPRPKRKPLHPYPRKLGHSTSKGNPGLEQPIWYSQSEQENGSPVSVLSAVASDSTVSNPLNGRGSPVSSATASDPGVAQPIERESGCQSPTSSVDAENPDLASTGSIAQDRLPMEFSLSCRDQTPTREGSSRDSQTTSLKLFGRTVLVTGSQKSGSSCAESVVQSGIADIDAQSSAPAMPQIPADGGFLGGPCKSSWSPWHGGLARTFYCLPSHGDPVKSPEATIPAPPWWWASFYGSLPSFPFISLENRISTLGAPLSSVEGSAAGGGGGERSRDVVESQGARDLQQKAPPRTLKPSANSAFVSLKARKDTATRGFAPYRRCVAEKQAQQHPPMSSGGRDGQSVGLCL